jgi:hypothetical protein
MGLFDFIFGYWKRKKLAEDEFLAEIEERRRSDKGHYYHDIMKVDEEYEIAKLYEKRGDIKHAIEHYQLAVDNYQYADNEYLLSPDSSYIIKWADGTVESHSGVESTVNKSYRKLRKLRRKMAKAQKRDYKDRLVD